MRTDYASEQLWETFQERVLDEMCEAQLDEETGDQAQLKRMRDTLQFKAIEDPRLEGVGFDEVRECVDLFTKFYLLSMASSDAMWKTGN